MIAFICQNSGADPGFDQGGGPQIVTGLKLAFWGLSFVEFWCWGLIFGGQGGGPGPRGPPLDPPLKTIQFLHENVGRVPLPGSCVSRKGELHFFECAQLESSLSERSEVFIVNISQIAFVFFPKPFLFLYNL